MRLAMQSSREELLSEVTLMRSLLVQRATTGNPSDETYQRIRRQLVQHPLVGAKLPLFVKECHTLADFWSYIKPLYGTWEKRRQYLATEFRPLVEFLEHEYAAPGDAAATAMLSAVDSPHVHDAWEKALQRRADDPEGAITAARTLLETVCKHILDHRAAAYSDTDDLPKLYKATAASLNLSPSQHTEQVFKQILGGCQAVVEGLGALRNRLSDAHGKGTSGVKPAPRHAELAVNLAGTMATFLVATWEAQRNQKSLDDLNETERETLLQTWLEVAAEQNVTGLDNLPFTAALPEVRRRFLAKTSVDMDKEEIFKFLLQKRKTGQLPKPRTGA
jgi:hypothetical protein